MVGEDEDEVEQDEGQVYIIPRETASSLSFAR